MSIRVPVPRDTSHAALQEWTRELSRQVETYINRLSIDIQLGRVRSYTVDDLPNAEGPCRIIRVTDESGGEVLAFNDSDGTWRRVTDRAQVS